MIPISLLNSNCVVIRRTSQGRDALNNPIYGAPTSGAGWNMVYYQMPIKLAFNSKLVQFAKEGERVQPAGIGYYNSGYTLQALDHIVTSDTGIEYVVTSIVPAYIFGTVVDHYEVVLNLP